MKYITFFTSWILDRFSHKSCPNWPKSLRLCWKAALFSQDTEADGGRRADSGTSWRFWTCSCSKVRSPKTPAIISFSQTGSKKWVAEIIAFRGRPGSLRHSGLKNKIKFLYHSVHNYLGHGIWFGLLIIIELEKFNHRLIVFSLSCKI